MTPVVFCVPVDAPIRKIVEKILALEVRCLFVTDEHGVLVGVISVFDLLRSVASPSDKDRLVRTRPLKPVVSTLSRLLTQHKFKRNRNTLQQQSWRKT